MNYFSEKFRNGLSELHILKIHKCNPQQSSCLKEMLEKGQALPTGFCKNPGNKGEFVHMENYECSDEELLKLMLLQQAKHIQTIKKCAVFFTAIVTIFLAFTILGGLASC